MASGSRLRLPLAGLLLAAATVSGAELRLPPLTGELAGDFTPLKLAGAPTLHWTLNLTAAPGDIRVAQLGLDGPGTHLRGEARLDAAGEGTWRVTEGGIEFKPWLGGQLATGATAVVGEGTWRGGALTGEITLRVRDLDLGELLHIADADKKHFQWARGRVEGVVRVRLRDGKFSRGEIALTIPAGTTALILFQPSPGLLSSYVPSLVRRKYPGIEAIELGQTPLEARVLRLAYSPTADAAGRSATLHLEGQPQDRKYVAPLELDFNFLGEVEQTLDDLAKVMVKVGGAN